MPTPSDMTTKLKAVNIMLEVAGEKPVSSLDSSESSLTQQAENALDEASLSVQSKGWYWNRESNYPLSLTEDNEAPLPTNTLLVHEIRGSGMDDLVQRGRKVYNRTTHSFTFTAGTQLEVDLVVYLDWEELPEFAKAVILSLASTRFQMRHLTSTALNAHMEQELAMAMTTLEQAEDAQGPYNSVNGTAGNILRGRVRRR